MAKRSDETVDHSRWPTCEHPPRRVVPRSGVDLLDHRRLFRCPRHDCRLGLWRPRILTAVVLAIDEGIREVHPRADDAADVLEAHAAVKLAARDENRVVQPGLAFSAAVLAAVGGVRVHGVEVRIELPERVPFTKATVALASVGRGDLVFFRAAVRPRGLAGRVEHAKRVHRVARFVGEILRNGEHDALHPGVGVELLLRGLETCETSTARVSPESIATSSASNAACIGRPCRQLSARYSRPVSLVLAMPRS